MAKQTNQLQISVSKNSFVDEGNGLISFPGGLTITDDSVQRNGTRYDINTLDIEPYGKQITADHVDSLSNLIAKAIGVAKQGNRVVVSAIQYALVNPYGQLAYDLFREGFSNSFSIETMGPYPDDNERVFYHAELVGLSQVVLPNNYNAVANQFNEVVHNSLERSKSNGFDTTGIEADIKNAAKAIEEESMTKEEKEKLAVEEAAKIEAEKVAADEAAAKEAADAEAKAEEEKIAKEAAEAEELAKKAAEEKEAAEKAEAAEALKAEKEKKAAEEAEAAKIAEEAKAKEEAELAENAAREKEELNKKENQMTKEDIAEIVANSIAAALAPVQAELAAAKADAQNALDAAAKAPEFHAAEEAKKAANALDELSSDELFGKQLNAAVAVERMHSVEGAKTLAEINARNLNALKEAKIVKNSLTLEDLGNFVIAPELYNEIATKRNDYTTLLTMTTWKETNSIDFGWLTRSSDIDMKSVPLGIAGDDGDRLKPISTPGYGANTDRLEEMAAVTPISINVIKFAAADILSDIAEGYRSDFDRKRAQLVIARLQLAVNGNGQVHTMDISDGLVGWAKTVAIASDATSTGTLIFNNKTKSFLIGQAVSTQNAAVLQEVSTGTIFGTPFVTVPNDLLPTLNTAETRTFLVHGAPVVITSAVFYADLSTFTGRTSGGLKYDVDGSASYEVAGVTYSAYQRNEVVLRGSFFRGGVVKDVRLVAAIGAGAVS
jgi:hypothetical protein